MSFPWYDAHWLDTFDAARETVARTNPMRLGDFDRFSAAANACRLHHSHITIID